ncbi:hypothetical protein ESY86_06815 [Subsaximicrobium wynnwilliamsii]|uniref:Cell wall anchor protein n=1 Tax=Subsaximicrobium wynnwilliamsii TaxID=291179 RepID=A0A5C6ZKM4_9FLAO|nr:hypothetical protein [Subsaximicrobium wynnwilliamsii]TXD84283.1 hypothetical protein ESY87_07230 [Subsaximicrobium wynnwilliamsii]TXD89904.1 hypothetical protein ESY86_06815 [Subsaximicrobium wynnwilliamsii]TXE03995.1 hypothetical protein ESY88_07225 [Subsaximicrobium wynnwilliamsii]
MRPIKLLFLSVLLTGFSHAQVGIGTEEPDASALLELKSESQGLLAPRMTTLQREDIESPAESLLVFDTDEDTFYFYNATTTSWSALANDTSDKRSNYKLVKSAADLTVELAAGGGSSYKLDTNTFYEINGTIALSSPIDLNNAYVAGMDPNEDVLSSSGVVFKGSTGGSIRNVTLIGTKAFEIAGPGIATNSSLLIQNTIIDGMNSVGSISGFGLYFGNIVQFLNNTNGITYSNIGNLLLNNQAWPNSNNGTFETFSDNFGLIEKVSGFSSVNGSDVALDVSSNPNVATGVLQGTVFTGTTSASSGYVKAYTSGSYTGYNFSNAWTVSAPGIPRESDDVATGDINFSANVGNGELTTFSGTGSGFRKKVTGTTASGELFRFEKSGNNRIIYKGNKTRFFGANASISFQARDLTSNTDGTIPTIYILYIAKGKGTGSASVITQTKVYGRASDESDIIALPIIGTIELDTDDYIEVWAERFTGGGDMLTVSLNVTLQ